MRPPNRESVPMSNRTLIDVKDALSSKYRRLATLAGSETKRAHFEMKATRYKRQADKLRRQAAAAAAN